MSDYKEPKVTQIDVGGSRIGLRNLDEVLERVYSRNIDDENELKRALIEEMRAMKNYIPENAEPEHERALLREYRLFMGQPVEEAEEERLSVKVLGAGCPNCHRLTDEVMAALMELNLGADVDHITDVNRIAEFGAVGTPALVINKKIRSIGRVPPRNQIRKWIEEEIREEKR